MIVLNIRKIPSIIEIKSHINGLSINTFLQMKKTRDFGLEDISVTRSWSLRVVTYHARCFDSFRFANAHFRFIVLSINDP